MNQTRTFLLFALMAVAYLSWMAWEQDYGPKPPAPQASNSQPTTKLPADDSVPDASAHSSPAALPETSGDANHALSITLTTDVLRLRLDTHGGSVVRSELLKFPSEPASRKDPAPPAVRLLDDESEHYFAAQGGLVSSQGDAPDHRVLFHAEQTDYRLADGQNSLKVDLVWQNAAGLKVTKSYTLTRGSYVVTVTQTIDNGASAAWQGNAYVQLQRVQPPQVTGWLANITNPSARSFLGAAWYSPEDKFDSQLFADFQKKPLNRTITGGWAAMLQHYFFAAWIPPAGETDTYSTTVIHADSVRPA
jgi:YidC/Oxa1 family membrane protein insertase